MPVEDGCQTELDLFEAKWDEADNICDLAEQAREEWEDIKEQLDCPEPPSSEPELGDPLVDPMDQHQYEECLNDQDLISAWNLYESLGQACDAAIAAAEAQQEAYEACLHKLHDSLPFA
ncbi:hypothetical protein SAMN02745148_01036 [Modicisalibacter ilicicola DSM 19980]|uniref:Uncharacterized protein n=1 Tax=Modicisalibacter ilicicola DSM 19980 TaxID=1121942 RepID=A0A1M4W0Y0_9GAMM|nr:hypothetical protein [Halomonas ilicicola]SHE74908.1 hypothetical protein SAMN02745148_01036 [Halomonas ilicicola DSM 19980]